MTITVKLRHPALGAEVRGVDMRQPLDPEAVQAVRDAWTRHLVLVFPEQDISDAEHVASRGISGSPRSSTRPRSTCARTV
jgi:alpha-ketoglutarate-dependent taurine dioxygenase